MVSESIETFQRIFSAFSIFIIAIGTIGNTLSLLTCLQKSLRSLPTFVFYSFMLVNDIICLYFWNQNHFTEQFTHWTYQQKSLTICIVTTVLQMSSLKSSAWLLVKITFIIKKIRKRNFLTVNIFQVCMSIERYLCIKIASWRKKYFNSKKAVIVSIVVMMLIYAFDSSLFFLVNFIPKGNETYNEFVCLSNPYFITWLDVSFFFKHLFIIN